MNINDVKEILDFKENADYKKLSVDEIIIIRDCITNLELDLDSYKSKYKNAKKNILDMEKQITNLQQQCIAYEQEREHILNKQSYVIENKKLKEQVKGIREERDYLFNKLTSENKHLQDVLHQQMGKLSNDLLKTNNENVRYIRRR